MVMEVVVVVVAAAEEQEEEAEAGGVLVPRPSELKDCPDERLRIRRRDPACQEVASLALYQPLRPRPCCGSVQALPRTLLCRLGAARREKRV